MAELTNDDEEFTDDNLHASNATQTCFEEIDMAQYEEEQRIFEAL